MKGITNIIAKLLVSILGCQAAGLIGSLFTMPAIPTWYAALQKPSFTPPNWLFGPAWGTLYLLMGIAAFLVWRQGLNEPGVKPALVFFLVQLVLNTLWSIVFFGAKSLLGGVVIILVLWLAILWTMLWFFKISTAAGALLVPYLLWVSYASVLTVVVWRLNT